MLACRAAVILAIAGLSLFPLTASGRTWLVREDSSGTAPTIQAAIDSAADGDTVSVMPGTYLENIDFRGKAILVRGSATTRQWLH